MTDSNMTVRLTRPDHAAAKARAAAEGVTIPALFQRLLTEYAEGDAPKAPPKAVPQSERTRTYLDLPLAVRRRVEKRAKAEGRSVSAVVAELVARAEA